MVTSKQAALRQLLESEHGIHLTAYLVNRGDPAGLNLQLADVLKDAYEWLEPAMATDERRRFLEPLESLLLNSRMFEQMTGNIGLFRTRDFFRVLNVPVDVELSCQVATSFHVKPLIRWLQADREFLLVDFERESTHLYFGSMDSFRFVDSISAGDLSLVQADREGDRQKWFNERIRDLTRSTLPTLFLAGDKSEVDSFTRHLSYTGKVQSLDLDQFEQYNVANLCTTIRKLLKAEAKLTLGRTLLEFKFAEEANRTRKNIFQISKAVVQGRVRKLIVTDELSIFGTIDKRTGGIAMHPYDLNHEDDCILDDLAQMVLSQGGDVIIAKRDEIPKGRPILAILDDDGSVLEKSEYLKAFDMLQERFG